MTNESLNKLSKDNILLLYRYLFFYTKEYVSYYGGFDWNDATIANFCQKHNIIKKGRRNQVYKSCFFWFSTFTPKGEKVNDVAHHFLRHIRNAIAHANIRKERRKTNSYIIVDDYDKHGNQSMHGEIKEDLFFNFLEIVINTKKHKNI